MPVDWTQIEFLDWVWSGPVAAASIFLASVLIAFLAHKVLFPLALRLAIWIPTDLDVRIINSIRWPITLGIVLLGCYLALTIPPGLGSGVHEAAGKWFGIAGLSVGVLALVLVVSRTLDWYLDSLASHTPQTLDPKLVPLFHRMGTAVIYGLGALLVLDLLSINISPLIAGLGLGGLAVALAVQPTLSNLFAGTYVMTEGMVSEGDYIELEGSVAGYVVDVGWRSTRIRTWTNNLVVIPNSKFITTIITNYEKPEPPVNIFLTCGVSYDSDLFKVEEICRDAMDEALEGPDGVKEYGGWFAFDGWGDSNVNFWLFLQAKDRLASFTLQSAVVQKVHRRLREEGIVISYPMRTVQFTGLDAPIPMTPQMTAQTGDGIRRRVNGRAGRRRRGRPLPRDITTSPDGGEAPAPADPSPGSSD